MLDSAHLFAGSHPKLARFGMGVACNNAGLASGNFCCANSAVNATTLCSASASVAAVPRTCAMSSFKAVLSIPIPLPSRQSATRKLHSSGKVNQRLTLKTAKVLGLTIFPGLLAIADEAHMGQIRPSWSLSHHGRSASGSGHLLQDFACTTTRSALLSHCPQIIYMPIYVVRDIKLACRRKRLQGFVGNVLAGNS